MDNQGLLDYFTRIDELIAKQNKLLEKLDCGLDVILPAGGGQSRQDMRKRIESGEYAPYNVKTFDLGSARNDEKVPVQGDFIHAWTDGELSGIGIRLGHPNNDIFYFNRHNPVRGFPFWKVYLTNSAQNGKTLSILVGKSAAVTAGNMASDIIAQHVGVYLQPEWAAKEGVDKNFDYYALLASGGNASSTYTVPAGKTLYIVTTSIVAFPDDLANASTRCPCFAQFRDDTDGVDLFHIGGEGGGAASFTKAIAFPAEHDFKVTVINVSGFTLKQYLTILGYEI